MAFISVTRLRLRSFLFFPAFFLANNRIVGQLSRAPGFLGGSLLADKGLVFWTVTTWKDQQSMLDFRNGGGHKQAMPKLADWCCDARVAHWTREGDTLPSWDEAHVQLLKNGRPSKLKHMSLEHEAGLAAAPTVRRGFNRKIEPKHP